MERELLRKFDNTVALAHIKAEIIQEELAKLVRFSQTYVSYKIENYKRGVKKILKTVQLAVEQMM